MNFSVKDRWAVVTGASSGIGKAIARDLARRGCHLVIVARREALLLELARELVSQHGVQVTPIALDLTATGAAQLLADKLRSLPISIVVNNAGVAVLGAFEKGKHSAYQQMINLNIGFLTSFTHAMIPALLALPEGARILNVGSVAGYQGVPNMAAYAATKAYVNHFSEGLNWEYRNSSLRVCCVEPGQTASEFFERAGVTEAFMSRFALLNCQTVARAGVDSLIHSRPRTVVGGLNKLLVFSLRLSPRWMVRLVISRLLPIWPRFSFSPDCRSWIRFSRVPVAPLKSK